jgi:hypothetical protein
MDKKEIYEHLAKIYLDASSRKKKKNPKGARLLRHPLFLTIVFVLAVFLIPSIFRKKALNSEIALVLQNDVAKINFNFDPAKKEIYSINLNKLNLTKFKTLGFSLKKPSSQDKISLRIELTNIYKEKSEVYLKDLPPNWQDYKIKLSDFKNISDWSGMLKLGFAVEDWNTREKKGIVYIDNIRLLR